METERQIKCPDCKGSGKETCNNPDHGFLGAISGIVGANESACPCCGHGMGVVTRYKDGKWYRPDCEHCSGTGQMTKDQFDSYCKEFGEPEEIEYIES